MEAKCLLFHFALSGTDVHIAFQPRTEQRRNIVATLNSTVIIAQHVK